MSKIAPIGNTREDDYTTWYKAVSEGFKKSNHHIILIIETDSDNVIGFFQYYTNADTFVMEEIQIIPSYQGTNNIFRDLYGYVISNLHLNVIFVEAYAHKFNHKSNGILNKLGLTVIGTNKAGNLFHYCGNYQDLLNWYSTK